ncbi:MAG: O-antigen ligase family protein [Chloroflexi bacterium]|nr:O-antigen ligase family protein [Chloroflexota bacterium]
MYGSGPPRLPAGLRKSDANCEPSVSPAVARLGTTIIAFLVYGAFEGLLKRLTRYAWYIYPIKDVFFLAIVLAWVASLSDREPPLRPPFRRILLAYVAVGTAQVFNPYLPSVVAGLTGLRADYMFATLFFFTFQALRTSGQVQRLARVIGGVAMITAVGAIAESLLGLQWVYQNELQVAITANYFGASGDLVIRPSSIGNGPGSAAMMQFIGGGFLLGLGALQRRFSRKVFYLLGAAAALTGIFLAATRIIWLMTAISASAFVLLVGRAKLRWGLAVGGVVGVAILLSVVFSSGEIVARFQTLETPVETYRTERYSALEILPEIIATFPLGAGVGWNVPRQLEILRGFYASEAILFSGVHNYLSILTLETGVLGLVLFVGFTVAVLVSGFLTVHRERDEECRALLVGCYAIFAGIALSFPFGGGLIGWPGEYFWVTAAVVMRLGIASRGVAAPATATAVAAAALARSELKAYPGLRHRLARSAKGLSR